MANVVFTAVPETMLIVMLPAGPCTAWPPFPWPIRTAWAGLLLVIVTEPSAEGWTLTVRVNVAVEPFSDVVMGPVGLTDTTGGMGVAGELGADAGPTRMLFWSVP